MGRGVACMSGGPVAYIDGSDWLKEDRDWDWNDFIDGLKEIITGLFPSMYTVDKWDGQELHRILENGHARIVVSEYCGCISISLAVRDDIEHDTLAGCWVLAAGKKFYGGLKKAYPSDFMVKMGTFSNGESVYRKE